MLLLLLGLLGAVQGVKRGDFKTCDESGFCRRTRALADRADAHAASWTTPYGLEQPAFSAGVLTAGVSNALYPDIRFALEVRFQADGVARIVMDEVDGLRQRYNETGSWTVQTPPVLETRKEAFDVRLGAASSSIAYGQGRHELQIQHRPILLTFLRDGQPHIVLNERGLLNMEHFRLKALGAEPVVMQDGDSTVVQAEPFPGFLPENEDGMWEETFGGKTDSKPKGPESLSLDITFPGYEHVFGIPQHASSLSLKQTRGGDGAYIDPYRLYNLDVFEYDPDSEMAIYGAIPLMKAHRAGSTVGVFAATGSEMWIDITKAPTSKAVAGAWKKASKAAQSSSDAGPSSVTTTTHWMAESGVLDLFIFLGPTSESVFDQYTKLTGRTPLPQLFAIAYHQCRWNYLSQTDVLDVQSKFDAADIPLDVIWLDIEYAEEHKYFIWDRRNFPEPEQMQEALAARGRKLVAIVDPHIKRDPSLYVYTEAQELDILSKMPDGTTEFEGWCWTGSSAWTDWFNPKSWDWWIGQFTFEKFKGSTKTLFVWNDMNEPAIFNGPEVTMQKDALHYGGWEHRDVHNIGGMIYQNLTAQGLIQREDPPKRPFVLTRAFFAGSQRFGAMWTGDNLGTWAHLASTVPMLLTNGIAGMTFSGADVGGFFGNPSPEMMVRWYQVGAFSPFFRAHGHIDTKRREPYLFEQPIQGYIRDAIRLRYTLLPAMYTAFYEASVSGVPILRPQYVMFPEDTQGFAIDDQLYLGSTGLLIKPVVIEGATEVDIYIADDEPYYRYDNHDLYFGAATGGATIKVSAPLGSLPVLHRGGSILPRRDLVRRSAILTWKDPVTLVIAVDIKATHATGSLYLDDGESYSNEKGEFILRGFELAPSTGSNLVLQSRSLQPASGTGVAAYDPLGNKWAKQIADVVVSEIVVLGLAARPSCVKLKGAAVGLEFDWTDGLAATAGRRRGGAGKAASKLTIKDAAAPVVQDWDIILEFGGSACLVAPAVDHEAALQSAECPVGRFLCRNEGHLSSCILRSRVNDGICDEECCDGSDETDGKADCPNRCAAVGVEHKKANEERGRKSRVGGAIRKEYITFGAKERNKMEAELAKVSREVERLEEREKVLKLALDAAETAEAGDTERKRNSQLFERIVEMQSAIKSLRQQRINLESQSTELSSILKDLSRDFNPNYQDMAVLGASRAYKDWQVRNGQAEPTEPVEGEEVPPPVVNDEVVEDDTPFFSDRELQAMVNEDPLALIDSLSTRVGPVEGFRFSPLFRIEEYLPDAWKTQFRTYKTQLVDILARTGIVDLPSKSGDGDDDHPELARARSSHTAVINEIRDAQKSRDATKESLAKDWGRDWEWKKLDGVCVEKDMGEYTYSVCFFGESHQKSNTDSSRTSLGRFDSWSTTAPAGTNEYYLKQVYNDGQRCWNGPARSAKVDLVCAPTNALLTVIEPEKCEYLFTVSSPAVCFPLVAAGEESSGKDEL